MNILVNLYHSRMFCQALSTPSPPQWVQTCACFFFCVMYHIAGLSIHIYYTMAIQSFSCWSVMYFVLILEQCHDSLSEFYEGIEEGSSDGCQAWVMSYQTTYNYTFLGLRYAYLLSVSYLGGLGTNQLISRSFEWGNIGGKHSRERKVNSIKGCQPTYSNLWIPTNWGFIAHYNLTNQD